MANLTHDQMAAILNAGSGVVYRGRIYHGPGDVANLPTDEQIAANAVSDADSNTSFTPEQHAILSLIAKLGVTQPIGIIIGTPHFSFPLPDPDYGDGPHGYRFVVAGDPDENNDRGATMIVGSDDPDYWQIALAAFSGHGHALEGRSTSSIGVLGGSISHIGVQGQSQTHTGVVATSQSGTEPALLATNGNTGYAAALYGFVSLGRVPEPDFAVVAAGTYLYTDFYTGHVMIKKPDGSHIDLG